MAESGQKKHARGTKKHSILRSGKNKRSGKYARQAARTEANKRRRIAREQAKAARNGNTYAPVGR